MTLTNIIAGLALIVSTLNAFFYHNLQKQCNELSKKQALTAQGAMETQLRSAIATASSEVRHCALACEENPNSEVRRKNFESAEEELRNAYEDACSKYIDGKIDCSRFEKNYSQEINNLVTDETQRAFYSDIQSPYVATVKVYKQWFRKE